MKDEISRGELFDSYISKSFHKSNAAPSIHNCNYLESAIGPYLPLNLDAKILDIGVGMGHFAFYATRMKGYANYSGVDISRECVEYVRDHITPNVTLHRDTLEFLQNCGQQYDVIIMFDVIEHLEKQQQPAYLRAVRSLLVDHAPLLLRTENTAIFTGYYQHTMDYTHEYNFSPASLEQLLAICGYTDVQLFGDPIHVTGVRSFLRYVGLKAWQRFQRFIYQLERPGCVNPTILTKSIYAMCRK